MLLAGLVVLPSAAQERANPFVPPPTDYERQLEAEERTRGVVRQMLHQYENSLLDKIDARFGDTMLKMLDEQLKAIKPSEQQEARAPLPGPSAPFQVPSAAVPGPQAAPAPAAAPSQQTADKSASKLPAGVKFVACVKGKPLYREQTSGTEFFSEARSPSGIDPCG
ncbi:hypothetical protein [Methylobacterium hispanicum]|uniref:hypothetical protein n=1 Tax=Methylobacterium hispanicum TaxID=270350 RepID=UPI001EDCFDB7|nr:hypothetical protein [Methylobacterium hispanicum]